MTTTTRPAPTDVPCLADVLDARRLLASELERTPTRTCAALSRAAGTRVTLKREDVLPTGAFKVRGALNLLLRTTSQERRAGVVAYSTGNHAQALAHAAQVTGTPCTIVMPENHNPGKAQSVRDLGATLELHGATFDEAAVRAREIADTTGARLVSAAEPCLVAGVGTAYLELVEQEPDLDVIVVPVGGGSGAAAACLVAAAVSPHIEVIAVQSAASPAAHDSWHGGACVKRANTSRAEGLATGRGFEFTQSILRDHLTDFVTVTDQQIAHAQTVLLADAHVLAEGAGAAALAAVLADPGRFAGRHVGVPVTGGNAAGAELRRLLPGLQD
ncbi:threonine dehydratase [Paraoerskovia marina]|uniref:threonine ammonia-lyase n=1 Tax=Paraoerskovia marina TaxID=545619 RepID=A0A1H1SYG3_9CELL|nr:pyridoxal-phosphate dependent enzyme [Paraoerskovia marina]SDS53045.1 threonine dehydratase [Paraoerskovia marina]